MTKCRVNEETNAHYLAEEERERKAYIPSEVEIGQLAEEKINKFINEEQNPFELIEGLCVDGKTFTEMQTFTLNCAYGNGDTCEFWLKVTNLYVEKYREELIQEIQEKHNDE